MTRAAKSVSSVKCAASRIALLGSTPVNRVNTNFAVARRKLPSPTRFSPRAMRLCPGFSRRDFPDSDRGIGTINAKKIPSRIQLGGYAAVNSLGGFVHTKQRKTSDLRKYCARGGTRTVFRALKALGTRGNMRNWKQSEDCVTRSEAKTVDNVYTPFPPVEAFNLQPHPETKGFGFSLSGAAPDLCMAQWNLWIHLRPPPGPPWS